MPDYLEPVEQSFVADVSGYIAGIEKAVAAAQRFADANAKAAESVKALQAAIDSLHGTDVTIGTDFAKAATEAQALQQAINGIHGKNVAIGITQDLGNMADATNAVSDAQARAGRAGVNWLQVIGLVHLGIMGLGAQVVADTIGIAAFSVATGNAFSDILSNWSTLTTTFDALNPLQKAAVTNMKDFMSALGGGSQQAIFTVFNEGLTTLEGLMHNSGGIVNEATQAFMQFFAELHSNLGSVHWKDLLGAGGAGMIRTDLNALFNLINALIGAIPALAHGFNDLGLFIIGFLTDAVKVLTWLAELDPSVTKAVVIIGGLLHIWSLLGSRISWLPGPVATAGKALGGLGLSAGDMGAAFSLARTEGIVPVLGLLTGLGPEGLAIAGGIAVITAAVIALGMAFANNNDPIQQMIEHIKAMDQANQYSLPVWQKGQQVLQQHAAALGKVSMAAQTTGTVVGRFGPIQDKNYTATVAVNSALQSQSAGVIRLRGDYNYLEGTYGLTADQARAVMRAVDLGTGSLAGNSQAAQENRFKIQQWINTQQQALNPMSQFDFDLKQMTRDTGNLATQTTDLTSAYQALLGPILGVIDTSVAFMGDLQKLTQATRTDGTAVGDQTVKQRDLASQLSQTTKDALAMSEATFRQTGNVQKSVAPLAQEVAKIEDLGLKGKWTTGIVGLLVGAQVKLYEKTGMNITQVAGLISKLDHIPLREVINIIMNGQGQYSIQGSSYTRGYTHVHRPTMPGANAAGGYITGPGTATSDSIPALLSHGEYVVKAASVAKYGTHMMDAINTQRFADGGLVLSGQYATDMVGTFRSQMLTSMVTAMRSSLSTAEQAAAAAFAAAGGGGGGPAVAMGQRMAAAFGWTGAQWTALYNLWQRESGWNPGARNPSSGAAGIPQDISGSFHGGAAGQIAWGLNYIRGRYGSPLAAWAHEVSAGWYKDGSWSVPGLGITHPGEMVVPSPWADLLRTVVSGHGAGGSGGDIHVHVPLEVGLDGRALLHTLATAQYKYDVRNSGKPTFLKPT